MLKNCLIFGIKFKTIKMKKTTITLGLSVLLFAANAQQTFKIKNPLKSNTQKTLAVKGKKDANARLAGGHNSVMQLAGNMVCNNKYVAGTTMNLSLSLDLTNTDQEYGDSLAITFPAGITPNTSTVNPNPFPAIDQGSGYVSDALNPISGQTISWGVNDNGQYGGISAGLGAVTFMVNVTITATVTGTQNANFFVSGDTYTTSTSTHGDVSGSFPIYPATANDLVALTAFSGTQCGLSYGLAELVFRNNGINAATNFPIKYSVNGGAPVVETYTATVNPGDTVSYVFNTPIAATPNTSYYITAYADIASDGYPADDTAKTNFAGTPYSITYTTSFEATPATDRSGWVSYDADGSGSAWATNDTQGPRTGTSDALSFDAPSTTVSDNWLFSPCLSMTAGDIYQVKYFKKLYKWSATSTNTNSGNLAVFLADSAATSHVTMTITPSYSLAVSTAYSLITTTFTAPATGNMNVAFEATGNVGNDTSYTIVFLDDVTITKIGNVGIKTLVNNADLSMYPNPTTGVLNITTTANTATVEIYNVMGQNVATKTIANGTSTIDISNLSNGVYSVQVTQNNTVTVGKIIKTN